MDIAATLHNAFAAAAPEFFGAEPAVLAQPGGSVPVKALVSEDMATAGDFGDVVSQRFDITILSQGGAAPAVGQLLTVGVRVFRLERKSAQDHESTRWGAALV